MSILDKISKHISKTCFDRFLISICIVGLIYQSVLLLLDYLNGTTVVNIIFGEDQSSSLPAITICLPYFYSIEKAANYDLKMKQLHNEYFQIISNFNLGNENVTDIDVESSIRLVKIYLKSTRIFDIRSISSDKIFDDYYIELDK